MSSGSRERLKRRFIKKLLRSILSKRKCLMKREEEERKKKKMARDKEKERKKRKGKKLASGKKLARGKKLTRGKKLARRKRMAKRMNEMLGPAPTALEQLDAIEQSMAGYDSEADPEYRKLKRKLEDAGWSDENDDDFDDDD
ncbi:hypothetical protein EIP86_007710 [Pleurotus ostreatoroseus]|nr:hypothetical protein EIP86_007710 [Pleurotus ostreatoroseus]